MLGNYALAQKAVLRYVGLDYPKKHDVGSALRSVSERLPTWIEIDSISMNSWLVGRCEISIYGDEIERRDSGDFFNEEDAELDHDIFSFSKRVVFSRRKKRNLTL
jgi:HEPN domain-containing protein